MKNPAPFAIVEDTSPSGGRPEGEPNFREEIMEEIEQSEHLTSRRSFLVKGAVVGAASLGAGGACCSSRPRRSQAGA
jgi:hypothetical protein